jgi:hypothetical protein
MMLPILLLNGDAELDADSAIDEDEFLAEVPDIIPACVAGIHEFWKNNGTLRKPRSSRGRCSPGGRRRH